MSLVWLALAFSLVVIAVSSVFVTRRWLELFRAVKQLNNRAGEGLAAIARSSGAIELHLQAAGQSGTELDASLERLRASRGNLAVLTAAIADVRASVGRITAFVPRR
jgi:hypothetical protein